MQHTVPSSSFLAFLANAAVACSALLGLPAAHAQTAAATAKPAPATTPTTAPAATQKLLPAQSQITFSIKQMGVPVEGRFATFDAQIAFNRAKPETGKVNFSIDLGSAVVGDADTVKELKKPDWFNVPKFPAANFASTAIKSTGANSYEIAGNLAIKGVSKPMVIPVTLTTSASAATGSPVVAEGSFALKRSDFKIGEGDWADTSIVANDVTVRFKLAVSGL